MAKINVTKRGKFYQYRFQLASQNGQRKWFSKSGFKTKKKRKLPALKPWHNTMKQDWLLSLQKYLFLIILTSG